MVTKPKTLQDDFRAAMKTIASHPGGWWCTNCLAGNDSDRCWFCGAASPEAAKQYAESLTRHKDG